MSIYDALAKNLSFEYLQPSVQQHFAQLCPTNPYLVNFELHFRGLLNYVSATNKHTWQFRLCAAFVTSQQHQFFSFFFSWNTTMILHQQQVSQWWAFSWILTPLWYSAKKKKNIYITTQYWALFCTALSLVHMPAKMHTSHFSSRLINAALQLFIKHSPCLCYQWLHCCTQRGYVFIHTV